MTSRLLAPGLELVELTRDAKVRLHQVHGQRSRRIEPQGRGAVTLVDRSAGLADVAAVLIAAGALNEVVEVVAPET